MEDEYVLHLLSYHVMSPGHFWRDNWTVLTGPLSYLDEVAGVFGVLVGRVRCPRPEQGHDYS